MGFIQFDFQKAYQQQLELDSIAAELNQLAERDMSEVLNQLQSAWSGENADAYLAKGILLQQHMNQTAKKVRNTANALEMVSKALRQAEDHAVEIAGKRTYGDK